MPTRQTESTAPTKSIGGIATKDTLPAATAAMIHKRKVFVPLLQRQPTQTRQLFSTGERWRAVKGWRCRLKAWRRVLSARCGSSSGKTGREARCLLLSGFLQRARQSRGAALWPLAVAHRWREVAQCADKSEESDSGESESGREEGEGWRWRGWRQLEGTCHRWSCF